MASILIIDDDVTLLARLGDQLADAGHLVEKTGDLTHAQQLHDDLRPELVILEVRTGGEGGWELLARLSGETAVIVLSSAGREEDVVRGFSNGAIDYVTKPYRSEELLARVRVRLASLRAAPLLDSMPALGQAAAAAEGQPPRTSTTKPLAPPPPRRRGGRRPDPADETVFMSEAEEMALLRMAPPAADASPPETADAAAAGTLGSRLRAERLRRHLTLVQVENEIKIRMSYLQAMEDEKFTLLPRGPVAIDMLRSYAGFLGLDAEALADEFRDQHYIDPIEPPRALGGSIAVRTPPRWLVLAAAVLLALAVAAGAIYALDPAFFQSLPSTLQALWAQLLGLFGAQG